jgi:hypothetical protein
VQGNLRVVFRTPPEKRAESRFLLAEPHCGEWTLNHDARIPGPFSLVDEAAVRFPPFPDGEGKVIEPHCGEIVG